jgi:hypothetical protein
MTMIVDRFEGPPEWHEALIGLIDALDLFIRTDVTYADSFLHEGQITRAQYNEGMIETKQMMALLTKLKKYEVDPQLGGVLK